MILLSQSFRGCPTMKRTIDLDVPAPSSPWPAPSLLRGWLAQVVRTSILRSKAESIENTPINTPAGANVSKSGGGNGGSEVRDESGYGEGDEGRWSGG